MKWRKAAVLPGTRDFPSHRFSKPRSHLGDLTFQLAERGGPAPQPAFADRSAFEAVPGLARFTLQNGGRRRSCLSAAFATQHISNVRRSLIGSSSMAEKRGPDPQRNAPDRVQAGGRTLRLALPAKLGFPARISTGIPRLGGACPMCWTTGKWQGPWDFNPHCTAFEARATLHCRDPRGARARTPTWIAPFRKRASVSLSYAGKMAPKFGLAPKSPGSQPGILSVGRLWRGQVAGLCSQSPSVTSWYSS